MYRPPFLLPRLFGLLAASLFLLPCSFCHAQEVDWRTDYQVARREAAEKNRPLMIDFGYETCVWCRKQDTTTFKEPGIVSLVNERFVPLRVDTQHDPHSLTEKLNIQTCPTIVFASSDGKILATLSGYQEAGPLQENLQRILAAAAPPEWMTRDFQAAGQAIASSDFNRALALLRTIVEDGKDRPIQAKSRQLLQELEQEAAKRLARAKQLADQGQTTDAVATTTDVIRTFSGTQAAVEASRLLTSLSAPPPSPPAVVAAPALEAPPNLDARTQQRVRRAREILVQAREDLRGQQYHVCLERCEILSAHYADLPEGAEAQRLASDIHANPEAMRRVCDNLGEQLANYWLVLADSWLQKGQPQQAAIWLERVQQSFPGTRQAEAAQVKLSQIQGQPTRPVDFQETGKK